MYNKEQIESLKYNELRRVVNELGLSSGPNPTKDHLKALILKNNSKEQKEEVSLEEVIKSTNYIDTIKTLRQQVKEQFLGLEKVDITIAIKEDKTKIFIDATIEETSKLSKADNFEIQEEAKAIQEQLEIEDQREEEENDDSKREENESEIDEVANELLKKFR